MHLVGERAALPDRELGADPRRRPRREGDGPGRCTSARSSRATSSTTRTRASTSAGRSAACSPSRWRPSALFTVGALRGVQAGCLLTVSDIVVEGEFKRITRRRAEAAVDRMTRVALATATAERIEHRRPSSSSTRRRRTARRGGAGRRSRTAPRRAGSTGDALFSERPGQLGELARERRRRRREAARRRRRRRLGERGRERDRRPRRRRDRRDPARHRLGLRAHATGSRTSSTARSTSRSPGDAAHDRPRPRDATAPGTAARRVATSRTSRAPA